MATSTDLQANWNYPSSMIVGAGRVKELPDICRQLKLKQPLLVTDRGLALLPLITEILHLCQKSGLPVSVFSEIQSNPTGKNVEDGVDAYNAGGHDGVIAIGGGSALDVGKAVALMAEQERSLWDFEDSGDNWKRVKEDGVAPIIAIPTTAGTGSEVGRASVIIDELIQVKKIIFHPKMQPAVVILDPKLTVGLPPNITAATGMDALSHNLEAYCSPFYHPMAQGIAVEGVRLVKSYLERAVTDGHDLEARTQMLVASSMGATAFQKGLGAMHALAHPLGALYNIHHGLLNAILMPYVLTANRVVIEERIERLARYLELSNPGFDSFINWVLALRERLDIPHCLTQINVDDSDAQRIGEMAVLDPSASGNPVLFDARSYADIFCRAVHGQL